MIVMARKHLLNFMMLFGSLSLLSCSSTGIQEKMFGDRTMEEVVSKLTQNQKIDLLMGRSRGPANPPEGVPGMPERYSHEVITSMSVGRVVGAAADSHGIDTLGIPVLALADGPAGLRISPIRNFDNQTYYCTAFPTGTSLAASWDVEGVRKMAEDIGNEVKEYGVDILLAPGMNIQRNPLCGRNFEYYSEDPYLTGNIAAAYVQGIQKNGVGATIKHFAANNQETMRNGIDVQVSERALREIYLKGFEIAVKKAQPWCVMSSYNKINGTLASQNSWLLETVLRKEWGFDGVVMTDWWAEENGALQEAAGNDLLMPGTQHQYDEIKEGLKNGTLTEEQLNRNVCRMLDVIQRTPVFNHYTYSNKPDLAAHAQTARRQAAHGMVLLENKGQTLPLSKSTKVALFGNASYDTFVGGSGSGNVNRKYKVNIDEGLSECGFRLEERLARKYKNYLTKEKSKLPNETFWVVPDIKEMPVDAALIDNAVAGSDVAIVTIGRMAGEGDDRHLEKGDYMLSDTEQQMIQQVLKSCHKAGKRVVLLLNMGSIIDLGNYGTERFDAIMHIWMPGQEAGNAVADVLSGKVSPSGKLPMTWACNYTDFPSAKNFPLSPGSDRAVRYAEDIFVGYRYFDAKHVKPLYPFGYGLSYTTFGYSNLKVNKCDDDFKVTVDVTNNGNHSGAEVVQLYVSAPKGNMPKPVKELRAFAKSKELAPGESQTLTMTFNRQDLASFDNKKEQWVCDSGTYTAYAAASSQDIRAIETFEVK